MLLFTQQLCWTIFNCLEHNAKNKTKVQFLTSTIRDHFPTLVSIPVKTCPTKQFNHIFLRKFENFRPNIAVFFQEMS